jgi:hypothetical protein
VIKTVAVGIFQIEIFALVDAVVGIAAGADIELAFFEHGLSSLKKLIVRGTTGTMNHGATTRPEYICRLLGPADGINRACPHQGAAS